MSTLLAIPITDSFRPRASTLGMEFLSRRMSGGRSHEKVSKSRSLPKSNSSSKTESRSIMTFFHDWRKGPERDSHEAMMARLEDEFARIRSDLSSLRTEGQNMEQRVADVTATVDQMVHREHPVEANKRQSLEIIAESDCESLEEEAEEVAETSRMLSKCCYSTTSLPASRRDSGYITDPAFEMGDPDKYCQPNNTIPSSSMQKKARSTTAIDFIRNNLYEDDSHLKATSYDRLSCFSDSALATFAIRRRLL